jgi:hypothetical protein
LALPIPSGIRGAKTATLVVLLVLGLAAVAILPLTGIRGQDQPQPATVTQDQVPLTVDSVDQNGSAISGYFVVLYGANGSEISTGETPAAFSVDPNSTYGFQVERYGACTFSRWSSGVTDDTLEFNVTTYALHLTAIYDCGAAALPSVGLVQFAESTCSYVCGNGSTITEFPYSVSAGDMVALTIISDDLTPLNVSDSLGTLIQLGARSASTACDSNTRTCQADLYWGMFPASGNDSVTVGEAGSDRALRVQAWEFSGVNAIGGGCSPVSYPAGSVLLATGRDAYGAGSGFTWEDYAASGLAGSEYQVATSPGSTAFPFSTGVNSVEAAAIFMRSPATIECGAGATTTTTTSSTTASSSMNATAFQLSVAVDRSAYTSNESMVVSGIASPPPNAPANATIIVTSPVGVVATASSQVSTTNGSYSYRFVTGGTPGWVSGTYTVTVVCVAYGETVTATATFAYAVPA